MPTFAPRALRRPLLLLAIGIGFACGPGAEEMGEFFSLFQPEAATFTATDKPYFFSPKLYNDDFFGNDEAPVNDSLDRVLNVGAWATYLGKPNAIELIKKALGNQKTDSSRADLLTGANTAAATYLRFAHAAERAAGHGNPWERVTADTMALRLLAGQARTQATTQTDLFLKERYAFQAVKLADEAGDWAGSQTAYEQLIAILPTRSFISDWARCRYAGALLSLGRRDEALLNFAQVFAHCPSRRLAAERSVRQQRLRYSDAVLALAKTDAERVAVLAICAIQPRQDALPLLEKMVALDPKNLLIELVLAREINRNEYYFAAKKYTGYVDTEVARADSAAFEARRTNVPDYASRLLTFAEGAAANTALGNQAYYLTAAAYLHYLNGNYASAKKKLDQATAQPTANQRLEQQIALQQMLLLAAQPGPPDAPTETQLISYLTQFGQNNVPDSANNYQYNFRFAHALKTVGAQLANRYLSPAARPSTGWLSGCSSKQETFAPTGPQQAKAYLMRLITTGQYSGTTQLVGDLYAQLSLEDTTSLETAQHLATYLANPASEFDERLVKLVGVNTDYVQQLVGRRAMLAERYDLAAAAFARVSPALWQREGVREALSIDPFSVNMPGEKKPRNPYTPARFATRLHDLAQLATTEKDDDKAAAALYQLGCGAFNLSYYGNAWLLARRYRSSTEPASYDTEIATAPDSIMANPYYTLTHAKQHFIAAAKRATNPEVAAKATYMAARCEAHALQTRRAAEIARTGQYIADDDSVFNQKMAKLAAAEYNTYGRTYLKTYRQTAFAREMQTRCALYRDIIGQ